MTRPTDCPGNRVRYRRSHSFAKSWVKLIGTLFEFTMLCTMWPTKLESRHRISLVPFTSSHSGG